MGVAGSPGGLALPVTRPSSSPSRARCWLPQQVWQGSSHSASRSQRWVCSSPLCS